MRLTHLPAQTPPPSQGVRPHPGAGGWMLAEAMVAVLTGVLLLLSMTVVFVSSTISFAAMATSLNLERTSRNALDHMTLNIRQAKQLTSFNSALLVFNYDSAGLTNLTYRYDPNAGLLTEEWNSASFATTNFLLRSCSSLSFSLFDRNLAPTTGVARNSGKVLSVAWKCAGTTLSQINSEDMQQAKIVIRNQP